MQKNILLSAFMLLVFSIALGATAETPVIGFIAQDTTWTQANSPYVTLGNIIVKEGVTLTIEPGVTVQFDFGHSLTIESTLIARGTDKQVIKFTPRGEKKTGAWDSIVFEDSSIDAKFDDAGNYVSGSILQYCTVEFAETAVKGNSASPFIDHCVISSNASRGISISKGDVVVIQDSMVADNKAGGGIFVDSESVTLTGNTITGNAAKNTGGGIYVTASTATISNNILTGNMASGGYDYHADGKGGGIYVNGGTVTISDNTLTGNIAKGGRSAGGHNGAGEGGGIYVVGDTVTLNNNTLTRNMAEGYRSNNGYGGGISVRGGTVTVSNNKFTGNTAQSGEVPGLGGNGGYGGGIYVARSTVIISNNNLTGNTTEGRGYSSDGYGGGICVEDSTATITQNILIENTIADSRSGSNGGGIYIKGGTVTIR